MNAVSEHLSDEVLREFKTGRLRDSLLEEQIAEHLGLCAQCEIRLQALGDVDDLIIRCLREPDRLQRYLDSGQLRPAEALASTKSWLSRSEDTGADEFVQPATSADPQKIGRFGVIRKLGRGGFADVYLCHDPRSNRKVAVKVSRRDRAQTAAAQEALLDDARKAAGLDHPSIVPVYDWQKMNDGRWIIVMKYIEGQSLATAIEKQQFSPRQAARMIAKVADALHYAHTNGFVHRDVKPANILLDKKDEPYLTDFGLALHEDEQHLHARERAGTEPYMSPEQTLGKSHHLDARADIWSLGVVLYELLTGKRPFGGRTQAQLFEEIREREHPSLKQHNPSSPARLEAACDRCLEKEVGKRYGTAKQLASELRQFILLRNCRDLAMATGAVVLIASAFFVSAFLLFPPVQTSGTSQGAVAKSPWTPFLDRAPTVLVRNISNRRNTWRPVPDRQRFEVRSGADVSVAKFGELRGGELKIRVQLRINGWVGFSGLIFGVQHVPGARRDTKLQCYAVRVGRSFETGPLQVSVEEFELVSDSGIDYRVQSKRGIASTEIPEIPNDSVTLEVHGSAGQVAQVYVDGQLLPLEPAPGLLGTDGGYGVTSVGEYCVFECGEVLTAME